MTTDKCLSRASNLLEMIQVQDCVTSGDKVEEEKSKESEEEGRGGG